MTGVVSRAYGKRRTLLDVFFLLAPIAAWMAPLLFPGRLLLFPPPDGAFYFYPMTLIGMQSWHAGIPPLWTNLIQCGFPLLADGQGGLLYPLNFLTWFLAPPPLANNLSILLQALLSAFFMYVFVRKTGIGRWPAIIAGWIWVLQGPVCQSFGSPALNGVVWWPLWFLLAEKASEKFDLRYSALTAATMGLGWLGGFPQTAYYGMFIASVYFLFRAYLLHGKRLKSFAAVISGWALAGVLGIGLSAIQTLPTMEMSAFSIRSGGTDPAFAGMGSMFPTGMIHFLIPKWGSLSPYMLAAGNLFFGFIPLAAVLLTLNKRAGNKVWFFWVLGLLGLALSFGKYSPFYAAFRHIPGFGFFRYPYRFHYWTAFSIAVLSAIGLDALFSAMKDRASDVRRMVTRLGWVTCLAIGIAAAGAIGFHAGRNILAKTAASYMKKRVLGGTYRLQDQAYYQEKMGRMLSDIGAAFNPLDRYFVISILLSVSATVLLLILLRRPRSHKIVFGLFSVLIILTVLPVFGFPIYTTTLQDIAPPPLQQRIPAGSAESRLYTVNTTGDFIHGFFQPARLDPNFNMLFNIPHVGMYSALGSRRYFDLMGPLGNANLCFGMPATEEKDVCRYKPILDLINAGKVVSNIPLHVPGLEPTDVQLPFLYLNNGRLPRAFVVPEARVMRSSGELLDSMHAPGFNPRSAVLLESDPHVAGEYGQYSEAAISRYADTGISLQADGPGWLVLTEQYYPGWHATVDGKKVPVYCGDYVFRALPLDRGTHRIEFRFVSTSFRTGAVLSLMSLAIALILFIGGIFLPGRSVRTT